MGSGIEKHVKDFLRLKVMRGVRQTGIELGNSDW